MSACVNIDCMFPGGNIHVDRIEGNDVYLQPDLRDSYGAWFYWCFRVEGKAGQRIRFHMSHMKKVPDMPLTTSMGPAVSSDEGQTWKWLGPTDEPDRFSVTLPEENPTLRLSMTVPYTHADFAGFLTTIEGNPNAVCEELTRSRQGRKVEYLRVGRLDGSADYRVLLLARSHCCETMASFVMEGMLQRILADVPSGQWLRDNVEFMVVPFVDADGVEEGDQGKYRTPHDHNRDYTDEPVYPETRAIMEMVPKWSRGRLDVMLDLHCPGISGKFHEDIHNVGMPDPDMWKQQQFFANLIRSHCKGPLPYNPQCDLPFGELWNVHAVLPEGRDSGRWACSLPGIKLSNPMEIPYALAGGVPVTPDNARCFGNNLADALQAYLR